MGFALADDAHAAQSSESRGGDEMEEEEGAFRLQELSTMHSGLEGTLNT